MSQHRSVWAATASGGHYAPLAESLEVDVAVIGAGITGLTAALMIQRERRQVALIDAGRVGEGTTGGTTGKVTSQHGLIYSELVKTKGEDGARAYGEANEHALQVIADLAAELPDDVQFERAPAYVYATDSEQVQMLRDECEAAQLVGLPATFTTDTDLPFAVAGALRFDNQAHFHPKRYCDAMAEAFVRGGGKLYEGTRALDVNEHANGAVVHTLAGDVSAQHVIVATLLPFVDHGGFYAKAHANRAYGVAARIRGDVPQGMYVSAGSPVRSIRPWLDGDGAGRQGLVVVGANHRTGYEDATPARWGELESWTREHFDVEAFAYRWSAQDYTTIDGVPYVGRSPRMRHTYVATGFRKWGLTNGTAAALMLAETVAGREHPWASLFDATRIGGGSAAKQFVKENARVGKRFVVDRIARMRAEDVRDLPSGEARLVKVDGQTVGAYRDPSGELHCVGVTCTHLGCTLQWNGAETSWDCPCHGSRFSTEGEVLNGPAVKPLERVSPVDEIGIRAS